MPWPWLSRARCSVFVECQARRLPEITCCSGQLLAPQSAVVKRVLLDRALALQTRNTERQQCRQFHSRWHVLGYNAKLSSIFRSSGIYIKEKPTALVYLAAYVPECLYQHSNDVLTLVKLWGLWTRDDSRAASPAARRVDLSFDE